MKQHTFIHPMVGLALALICTHANAGSDHAASEPADKPASTIDAHAEVAAKEVDPDDALQMLMDGNRRFTAGETSMPRIDQLRRCETFGNGQHPFATILSCADSRVPPEIVFDQGIGDLFVVRIAGNVADTDELATMEYGAAHLGSRLIVVMGHTKCGAVTAVVEGAKVGENLTGLLDNVVPPVVQTKKQNPTLKGSPLVARAIRANVLQSMQDIITNSPDLRAMMVEEKIKVVGAVYDIHSGTIDWLGEHPRQAALITGSKKNRPKTTDDAMHNQSEPHSDAHEPDAHNMHTDAGLDAPSDEHAAPQKKSAAPVKKAVVKTDAHSNAHHETDTTDAHSHADKSPDKLTETSADTTKRYIAIGAFTVGTLALSGVAVALIRK
jgi:carbonic anhydrase